MATNKLRQHSFTKKKKPNGGRGSGSIRISHSNRDNLFRTSSLTFNDLTADDLASCAHAAAEELLFDDSSGNNNNSLDANSSIHTRNGSIDLKKFDTTGESRRIFTARWILVVIFLVAAAGFGSLTYVYISTKEQKEFETNFEGLAQEVIQVSQINANNNFDGMKTLSDLLTSYAFEGRHDAVWPFVTHPNWPAVAGTIAERLGARFVATVPFLEPELRPVWENYTVENQGWIQEAIDYVGDNFTGDPIIPHLFEFDPTQIAQGNSPFVYEKDPVDPDYPFYMPLWQSTLVENPPFINFDARNDVHFNRNARHVLETHQPVMSPPMGAWEYDASKVMALPEALICQPIFDSFGSKEGDDTTRKVVGIVDANVPLTHFDNILSGEGADGIVVVLSNPCSQPTDFSWEIYGQQSVYLGQGDLHDTTYDKYGIQTKATGLLTAEACPYMISLYPCTEFEAQFLTTAPVLYTIVVVGIFLLALMVFILYDFYVQKRHKRILAQGIQQAHRAAVAERQAAIDAKEQNEYLAHEVRNPLAAALSACSFVKSAIFSPNPLGDAESTKSVRDDVTIIDSSLKFINDLLRNMLDLHRAVNRQVTIQKKDVDLFHDVLEPVASMLYCRDDNFELVLDCPRNLVVETDSLRLKQILLNLGRNAAKFVEKGFVRLRAEAVCDDNDKESPTTVRIYVEDSGPGIPPEKRESLFSKFQQSLDLLSQGTGVGLCLCKQLIGVMGADLWLDEDFDSGVEGCPGACFVLDLRTLPKQLEQIPLSSSMNDEETKSQREDGTRSDRTLTITNPPVSDNIGVDSSIDATQDGAGDDRLTLPEKLSVLFVDDEMIQRKLFGRSIKRLCPGWQVQEASSGETAIRLVETETFDVIFMDQYMASTEKQLLGTEATRELRAKGVQAKICGLSANDAEHAFLNAGADGFILKPAPCDKAGLEKCLIKLLYSSGRGGGIISEEEKKEEKEGKEETISSYSC